MWIVISGSSDSQPAGVFQCDSHRRVVVVLATANIDSESHNIELTVKMASRLDPVMMETADLAVPLASRPAAAARRRIVQHHPDSIDVQTVYKTSARWPTMEVFRDGQSRWP